MAQLLRPIGSVLQVELGTARTRHYLRCTLHHLLPSSYLMSDAVNLNSVLVYNTWQLKMNGAWNAKWGVHNSAQENDNRGISRFPSQLKPKVGIYQLLNTTITCGDHVNHRKLNAIAGLVPNVVRLRGYWANKNTMPRILRIATPNCGPRERPFHYGGLEDFWKNNLALLLAEKNYLAQPVCWKMFFALICRKKNLASTLKIKKNLASTLKIQKLFLKHLTFNSLWKNLASNGVCKKKSTCNIYWKNDLQKKSFKVKMKEFRSVLYHEYWCWLEYLPNITITQPLLISYVWLNEVKLVPWLPKHFVRQSSEIFALWRHIS